MACQPLCPGTSADCDSCIRSYDILKDKSYAPLGRNFDQIIMLDKVGKYCFAWSRPGIFWPAGYTQQTIIGGNVYDVFPEQFAAEVMAHVARALATNGTIKKALAIPYEDGVHWGYAEFTPISDLVRVGVKVKPKLQIAHGVGSGG